MGVDYTMGKIQLKSLDVDVINFILYNNEASIDELCNCFEVSQVNIRNVLIRIEEFFLQNNIGKLLKEDKKYYFENNYINLFFNPDILLTNDLEKKERILYIALKLILEKSINLTSISKKLKVSRITLNSDIEIIKKGIESFNLELISIQWQGIFLKGKAYDLQKFSVLFLAKLYIENYFSSPLKKIINPIVYNYFRKFIDKETETKLFSLCNKIYYHFNIELGKYHYYILLSVLIYTYLNSKKDVKFSVTLKSPSHLIKSLNKILNSEDKNLLNNNLDLVIGYLIICIYKKYPIIFPIHTEKITQEIYSVFQIEQNFLISQHLNFFIYNMYFENKFFIPAYVKFDKKDKKLLEDEEALKLISIFNKYKIPFKEKNISSLYYFLKNEITQIKKKNILIIDHSIITWETVKLKEKLKLLEHVNTVQVSSYFNFKYSPIETYNKYDVLIFVDLPNEMKINYCEHQCCFVNSYELLKNTIDISKLF